MLTLARLFLVRATIAVIGCVSISHAQTRNAATLVVADHVDHLDALAREPMIVEHPDGTLFVSGYGQPGPKLWKSSDQGKSWTRVNVGTEADGAIGNADVDLAVARDGTLYFVNMGFDLKTLQGTHIAIGVSKDVGVTWRWSMLSKHAFDDRPWVEVAVDGTAHVIWNDGDGVRYAISRDRGVTWVQRSRILDQGGSSHLAVGPKQEVAVRVTPLSASGKKFTPGVDVIAVSNDGGASWRTHAAPGQRMWSGSFSDFPPRWVEPLAWDERGALYSLWTEGSSLWLARTLDLGKTWTTWRIAETDEASYFPYLIGRGRGELIATWFSGRGDTLRAHVGRIVVSEGEAKPWVIQTQPFQLDSWSGDPPQRSSAGEYLAATFLRKGGFAVVSPIQNRRDQRLGFSWWRLEIR